ncbi:MAG: tetratricopeptide repeat protein [Opitutales bacterium]
MARFTKKIRLTLILSALVSAVTVPVQAVPYVEQGDIESYAKLREVERYQIKIAQKFYQAADYKAAGAEFEKFLTLYERSTGGPYALMMWAHCQIHIRLVNTAIRDGFQSVIDYWPDSHEAIVSSFMIGRCLRLTGEVNKAQKTFRRVITDNPDHHVVMLAQGQLLELASIRNDIDEQVKLWTEIAFKSKKTKTNRSFRSSASRSLAGHYFRQPDFDKALLAIKAYYGKNEHDLVRQVHGLGGSGVSVLNGSLATRAKAEKLADRIISYVEQRLPVDLTEQGAKDRLRDYLNRIAGTHAGLDRDKRVMQTYERLGKLLGIDDEIRSSIASWHKKKLRRDEARRIYGQYDDKIAGQDNIASMWLEEKKYEQAVFVYNRIMAMDDKENEAKWHVAIAGTWRTAGQWDKAIATYQTLLKVDSENFSDWYWGIAECYESKAAWALAIQAYRQTDNYPEGYFRMAECNLKIKNWTESLVMLNQAKATESVAPRAQFRIAQVYELWTKKEKAIKSYQMVCKLYPKTGQASNAHAHLQSKFGISVTLGGAKDE